MTSQDSGQVVKVLCIFFHLRVHSAQPQKVRRCILQVYSEGVFTWKFIPHPSEGCKVVGPGRPGLNRLLPSPGPH